MKLRFTQIFCSSGPDAWGGGACLHAVPGTGGVQARACVAKALEWRRPHAWLAALSLALALVAPLRAQEAAPADQDKAPAAAVVAPVPQSGPVKDPVPTDTQKQGTAEAAPAPVAPGPPASAVVLEAPTPSVAPELQSGAATRPDPAGNKGADTPAPHWIERGSVEIFGSDVVIRENERASKVVAIGGDVEIRGRVDGEVVAIGGDVTIAGPVGKAVAIGGDVAMRGRVDHEVVALGGDVTIDGPVGKVVAVLGDVTLGPKASVAGEAVSAGGHVRNPDHAPVGGKTVETGGVWPKLAPVFSWVCDAGLHARPLTPHVAWPWYVFGAGVLFFLGLAAIFGRGVNACARVLEEIPGSTLGTAVVLVALLPLLLLLLVCTVVGILFVPFLGLVVLLAVAFGKAAMLAFLGRSLLRACGAAAALERAWLTVLVGAVLLGLLYCLPVVGLLVWALTTWVGFGMVVAAIAANRRAARSSAEARRQAASAAVSRSAPWMSLGQMPAAPAAVAQEPTLDASGPASPVAEVEASAGVGQPASVPPVIPPALPLPALGLSLDETTLPRADFGQRLGAILIDIVLVAVASGVSVIFAFLPFPLVFGGYVFGFWLWRGTTVGGIVFNLKVVRLDGRAMDPATALVRTLVAFLSVFAMGLGFLWCLWDPECQTWHDKVAGTVVVRVPKSAPLV